MLKEENELLTRVGPGTPMGELLRRFWLPVILASELPAPDCPPIRVRHLGEDLVAFRDTSGKVGLMAANCPHRGASLFFGRNEESGLRCVYHGWKFDSSGACMDMPSEPAESNFKDKVRATAYPTHEGGGAIWAYLGPTDRMPALPHLEWALAPQVVSVRKHMVDANFAQVMEGLIDSVHTTFLHTTLEEHRLPPDAINALGGDLTSRKALRILQVADKNPRFTVKDTDFGALIAARRNAGDDHYYWRITQWLMPNFVMVGGPRRHSVSAGAVVPIDDEHCFHWGAVIATDDASGAADDSLYIERPQWAEAQLMPGTWKFELNKDNDYRVDREAQKTYSYTGIFDHGVQDLAMTEGMGPIYDRTREHLGTTDLGIITMRRRLMQAAQNLEEGTEPYAAQHPEVYRVRAGSAVLRRDVPFDADQELMETMLIET